MNYNFEDAYSGFVGGFVVILGIILLITLVAAIFSIIAVWKLFNKAGKKGWHSIIPFYNTWELIEIAGLNWWWFLLIIGNNIISLFEIEGLSTITSLVSLFASFNCYYNIAKKFNKDTSYCVCAGIFSFIFIFIFGFSKDEVYDGCIPVSKNGVFGKTDVASYNNTHNTYQNNIYHHPVSNDVNNNGEYNANNQNLETPSNTDVINEEIIFCGNCGTKFDVGDRFCPNCGKQRL